MRDAVGRALAEDLGGAGDITTDGAIPASLEAAGIFVAREPGVLAGLAAVRETFAQVSAEVQMETNFADGDPFPGGARLMRAWGPARAVLKGERIALNFLQRLSGIATLTRRFVDAVKGTNAKIYDTRKTTPGLRALEKHAVRAGGGENHRFGLHDAVLLKDNHWNLLARAGVPLGEAVAALRKRSPGAFLEIEVTSAAQLETAVATRPDAILLDNMGLRELPRAVAWIRKHEAEGEDDTPPSPRPSRPRARLGARQPAAPAAARLAAGSGPPGGRGRNGGGERMRMSIEASGGVQLTDVRAIAETGVDRISVGALTHSARALDIALEVS